MNLIEEFNSKGDILLERIRSLADGKTVVTLFNELNHATLDVIASVLITRLFLIFLNVLYQSIINKIKRLRLE